VCVASGVALEQKGFVAYVTITGTKDFVEASCVALDVVAEREISLRLSQFPELKIFFENACVVF